MTVADAASAESLYREDAALFDLDHGQIAWRDQHYRITDLLPGATVVVAFGGRSSSRDCVTRLLEHWGLAAWTVPDTATNDLRARVEAALPTSAVS